MITLHFLLNLIPLRTINLIQFCEVLLSFTREQRAREHPLMRFEKQNR